MMKIRENFEPRFIHAEKCTILPQNRYKSQYVHYNFRSNKYFVS